MATMTNRADQLWKNWEEHEKQLANISGTGNNTVLLMKHKYQFLKEGLNRITNPSQQEKLFVKFLNGVTGKLQRQIYPNPAIRFLHRMKMELYDRPKQTRKFKILKEENLNEIKAILHQSGFGSYSGKLENHLDYERPKVNIELTSQLSDTNKLDMNLHIEKDENGRYRLEGFTAILKDALTPENERSHYFKKEDGVTATMAASLLQGRAVLNRYSEENDMVNPKWIQLDFSQKTMEGNFKLKEFNRDYGYDVKQELTILAVNLEVQGLVREANIAALERGNQVAFNANGKEYRLEASPGTRGIIIRDNENNKISMELLKNQLTEKRSPFIHISKSIEKKQGFSQEQSQGIGL